MQNDGTPMTSETHFSPEATLAWQGVALALDETPSGRAAYRVKLWPANDQAPAVCLFETFESEAAIAEWRRQAEQHDLPRYIERSPGAVEAASGVPCPPPAPRRRGATLVNRRPSHLRRRRVLLTLAAPAG
jgi:hypothetical protein